MADTFTRAREDWLNAAARELGPAFARLKAPLPGKIRITMSLTRRSRAIGTCYDSSCSADETFEILIRLDQAEAIEVIAILAHELVHAAVGLDAGHGPVFARVARGLGLEGKMTSTVPGEAFKALVKPILQKLGAFPHAALSLAGGKSSAPKKQTTRMVKLHCTTCGYVARTTRKWIDEIGPAHCPKHGEMAEGGAPGEDGGDAEQQAA